MAIFMPENAADLEGIINQMIAEKTPVEILGAGTKRGFGRPMQTAHSLALEKLSGIVSYEPAELVMTAKAGTPLGLIEDTLQHNRQALAFEPPIYADLFASPRERATIGGAFAINAAGSRRFQAGAARDHLLGAKAVTGRGEYIKTGGKVVKNVSGYDLCKLFAGSFGTLCVVEEVTFRVVPASEKTYTVLLSGLDDSAGGAAMRAVSGLAFEVSGYAHLPEPAATQSAVSYVGDAKSAVTAFRIEGPAASVRDRAATLKALLSKQGPVDELHSHNSTVFWREVREATLLGQTAADTGGVVWRVSVPPTWGPKIIHKIQSELPLRHYFDWAGGLVWIALDMADDRDGDGGAAQIRSAVAEAGGHATLYAAPEEIRRAVPILQPPAASLAALNQRLKEGFDPFNLLNPGRL